jgi:hypothetical protein
MYGRLFDPAFDGIIVLRSGVSFVQEVADGILSICEGNINPK